MPSLSGARAIVTGGGRGIGLAIAKLFASEGVSISLVGRDQARLRAARETLESLPNQSGTSHRTHAFDVGALQGWDAMLTTDLKADRIDVLVNAAGITQNSLLSRTRAQDAQDIINTNLMGTIWGCQTVSKRMIRQRHGCIVNVSSLLATHAGRGASVYSASKAGIIGLTRSLAGELGRSGVRINALLPGYIQTDMTASMDDKGELSALIPLGRLGLAEEVADAAAFLVKNPYAHNTVLNLDGGLSAT